MTHDRVIVYLKRLEFVYCADRNDLREKVALAEREQTPFTVFELRHRSGHADRVWHPTETRFFDPKKVQPR